MLRTPLLTAAVLVPVLAAAQSTKRDAGTIQVTSRLVYVDVTVRNSAGNVVHGLNQNDFYVFVTEEARQIYKGASDRFGVASVLEVQGNVLSDQGDLARLVSHCWNATRRKSIEKKTRRTQWLRCDHTVLL